MRARHEPFEYWLPERLGGAVRAVVQGERPTLTDEVALRNMGRAE